MSYSVREFTPKSLICLREGYSWNYFLHDLLAGVTIGIISIPLTMAFAIASGVSPEKGLLTGIIAGFLISLLGGSRVQIGGPTGAFAVIIYSVVMRHGFDGLILATLLAGAMMIIFGLVRAGVILRFVPHSVTTGFTAGIALSVFSSQMKDFFGLSMATVPVEFLDKWHAFFSNISTINPWACAVGIASLIILFGVRRFYPLIPSPVVSVVIGSLAVLLFDLPVETIQTKFGGIPDTIPLPSLPSFSLDQLQAVFPDAITIALLGSIESLLSAVIADGITGQRHRSNTELLGQGIANIASALFGGIPATGAIARTAANIRLGAKTPVAGMTHALTMLFVVLFFSTWAAIIPLPVLAAILIFVAWNMAELEEIRAIFRTNKSDSFVLVLTFLLTIFVDLTVAVQVGVLIAAIIFMKKMTDVTSVKACKILIEQENHPALKDSGLLFRNDIPENTVVFEVDGPLFFGSAFTLREALQTIQPTPQVFILRLNKTPLIDASGAHALKEFAKQCEEKHIVLLICDLDEKKHAFLHQAGIHEGYHHLHVLPTLDEALKASKFYHPQADGL